MLLCKVFCVDSSKYMENDPSQIKNKFLESYDAHSDAIFRYCFFQTSNREVALDLSQDTFIKVWEYLAGGKQVDNIRAFLYTVARNLIIDYRRKKKSVSLDKMMDEGFDVSHSEQEHLENRIDGSNLVERLEDLEEKYRDVLTMRYIDDLSIKEIAEITGESENNISVRIHRGLEKAKNIFGEQEV